jgi:hypothetical protein
LLHEGNVKIGIIGPIYLDLRTIGHSMDLINRDSLVTSIKKETQDEKDRGKQQE